MIGSQTDIRKYNYLIMLCFIFECIFGRIKDFGRKYISLSTQAIIHYIGDETLSVMTPHGNSNKNEPFFRTKPSVREDIQKKIEVEKPHIVYKNQVCENVEGHDAISKPRNIKQLHNAKASKQEEIRLTRDAIYNTHELAYEGGFIHFLSTYPDLCVVAGEVEMIQELNSVIQLKEFYVSPLVFKHVFKHVVFTDNPLVAGLFLIHERKLSETHEHFFKILSSLVKPLKAVPIVTDMESAIVKAIRENTTLKQIGCWRHLRQDVQRWLTDNLPKVERSTYVNELYEILRTTTERQCADMIKKMEKQWNEEFTRYFKKSVEPNGNDCGLYAIANATALAFGRDPSKEQYIPSKLREHLLKCLEEKEMRLFPTAKGTSKRRKAIKKIENIKLYCVCNMPDTHTTYFLCDQCSSEYHPECLGLDAVLLKDRSFICPTCSTK